MGTRQQAREETRARVVEAARELFEERGYARSTVRDIAALAGVSAGTVMSVGDKDALLVDMFDSLIAAEHARRASGTGREAWARAASPEECAARSVDLVRPFLDLFANRLELARTYGAILLSGRHTSAVFSALAECLIAEFIELLDPVFGEGSGAMAEAMHAAYIGTLFMWGAAGVDMETAIASAFSTICAKEQP
ncbi:MAG: TetR/AcrR family transcriptional regulator [Flaviflexus sp.]|nr:TetR/AcrR family transcriptional regulator [Flaviflexus sp.]